MPVARKVMIHRGTPPDCGDKGPRGGPFETRVRQVLDKSSTFRARTRMKKELLNAMYLRDMQFIYFQF